MKSHLKTLFSRKENIYVLLAISSGIVMAFINPPFAGVPDEPAHYWKAWSVALGQITCQPGNIIPKSAYDLASSDFPQEVSIPEIGNRIIFNKMIDKLFEKDTDVFTKGGMAVCKTPPLAFLPQALGLRIGRFLHLSALGDLYLARLCNLVAAVFLLWLAIRIIPFGKTVLLIIGLLPMTIQQCASLSYDSLHIAACFLFIAYIMKLSISNIGYIEKKEIALLFVIGLLSVNTKYGYIGLVILVFMLPVERFKTKRRYWLFTTGYVFVNLMIFYVVYRYFSGTTIEDIIVNKRFVLGIGYVGLTYLVFMLPGKAFKTKWRHRLFVSGYVMVNVLAICMVYWQVSGISVGDYSGIQEINFSKQLLLVVKSPIKFLFLVIEAIYYRFNFYLETFLYKPGWLYVNLEPTWYMFVLTGIAILLRNESEPVDLTRKQRFIMLSTFLINMLVVFMAQYLGWTYVGANVIEGVQGRYLLCISPLLIFFFYKAEYTLRYAFIEKHTQALLLCFYLVIFGGAFLSLYNIYYNKEPRSSIAVKLQKMIVGH